MFEKVLVANRGEIALRVLTSLQDHGIKTVVTASDMDRYSLVARRADEVIYLPGSTALETYLDIPQIVDKAKDIGVDAVHPGYGFLSENAIFAEEIIKAGITFVGPLPEQMLQFGDKLRARDLAIKTNTPLIEGTRKAIDDVSELKERAKEIGFPLLIKASAGGGGRGIRMVRSIEEFDEQLNMARNEAKLAFNDDRVYLEKFIEKGRHIEVQILGTGDGTVYHFGERDCTMQRKNQKLIEEAPATEITREKAAEMHQTAVELTSAIKYRNAGTVEFLYDPANDKHYFLEVNARIQVEHPVTEMITGEDLIWRQFQVAAGEDLNLKQEDITFNGHAIEARIYAENPYQGFAPSPGRITKIRHPIGAGVRVDSAIEDGCYISPFYDPMISKLIVKAVDRRAAITKLALTLDTYLIAGVHTTIPYIKKLLTEDEFCFGNYHTKYLDTYDAQIPEEIVKLSRAIAGHSFIGFSQEPEKQEQSVSKWRTSAWPSYR